MHYQFKNIGFTAGHVSSLTEAAWLEEAKGQYNLEAESEKDEIKTLKEIHKECCKICGVKAKSESK